MKFKNKKIHSDVQADKIVRSSDLQQNMGLSELKKSQIFMNLEKFKQEEIKYYQQFAQIFSKNYFENKIVIDEIKTNIGNKSSLLNLFIGIYYFKEKNVQLATKFIVDGINIIMKCSKEDSLFLKSIDPSNLTENQIDKMKLRKGPLVNFYAGMYYCRQLSVTNNFDNVVIGPLNKIISAYDFFIKALNSVLKIQFAEKILIDKIRSRILEDRYINVQEFNNLIAEIEKDPVTKFSSYILTIVDDHQSNKLYRCSIFEIVTHSNC